MIPGQEVLIVIILAIIDFFTLWTFSVLPKEKGYEKEGPTVWLLGIIGTPIIAGLYVAALPDKFARPSAIPMAGPSGSAPIVTNDELPSL